MGASERSPMQPRDHTRTIRAFRPRLCAVAFSLALGGAAPAAEPAAPEADLVPLASAAPQGLGPITLPGLSHTVLGSASVFGGARPDVFVMTRGGPAGLHLLRYLRTGPGDAPIFAPPQLLPRPFADGKGAIFAAADASIHVL